MKIDYTLWPNPNGELGVNKVTIPTGIGDDTWPDGDALINNVVYKDGKISGFVDTKALTVNERGATDINYDYIDAEFSSIEEGQLYIDPGPRLKYKNIRFKKLPEINADYMFYNPTTEITEFIEIDITEINNINLFAVTSANHMFTGRSDKNNDFMSICADLGSSGKISKNTCLGIIYRGNTNTDIVYGIMDNYTVNNRISSPIDGGVANIEIDGKIYTYNSPYKTAGVLTAEFISFDSEDNPYFVFITADNPITETPKPIEL